MFGDNLKKLRKEHGISQKELAEKLFISQQAVAKWESDKASPNPEMVARIAELFGTTTDRLLGREETKKAPVPPAVTTEDEELMEYLEELKTRPEMRMLFSLSKNATKEDVEDAVRIIEALRKGRQS